MQEGIRPDAGGSRPGVERKDGFRQPDMAHAVSDSRGGRRDQIVQRASGKLAAPGSERLFRRGVSVQDDTVPAADDYAVRQMAVQRIQCAGNEADFSILQIHFSCALNDLSPK